MPRPKGSRNKPKEGEIARPYRTPEELRAKMEEYFRQCKEDDDVFPDKAGMRIFLGLGHRSYNSYMEDPDYELVFDWAQDMRESWGARGLAKNPRNAQAFLNILKQSENGGWVDRKTDKEDKVIEIRAAGVGGVEAFK
ncbi:MAG: hypothetical protein II493_05390 [Spirochaetales bacterium]|nr:hypothetical protein [Spirochaetales bacterium]